MPLVFAEGFNFSMPPGVQMLDAVPKRTLREDLTYEGFRDLACRIQDYGKLYQLEAELRDELLWAQFPSLIDADGIVSTSYLPRWALWHKLRLWLSVVNRNRKTKAQHHLV